MTAPEVTRCLSCYNVFPQNHVIESLPVGSRVAFDPALGRLWILCDACSRWTLVPFESRWEPLEELERECRTKAKLLKQGENVALFRSGDMDIVRVGKATLREESWWRFGDAFLFRADRARDVARDGKIMHVALWTLIMGFPFWGLYDPASAIEKARDRQFGRDIWMGSSRCNRCGDELHSVRFAELGDMIIESGENGLGLVYTCEKCEASAHGHRWTGVAAEHMLRRGLAFHNFAGADRNGLDSAMTLLGNYKTPDRLLHQIGSERRTLASMSVHATLAAEIAVNAAIEDELLRNDVAAIEARWREEELLAGIIDRELTPLRRVDR